MRISDWSSDVCSSDLVPAWRAARHRAQPADAGADGDVVLARLRTPAGARSGLRAARCRRAGQPRQPVPHHPRHVPGPDGRLRAGTRPAAPLRVRALTRRPADQARSEEHTSELQSIMRISYAVFCLKKKKNNINNKKII